MQTNMNFVNVHIAKVITANNIAYPLRKPAMWHRNMGKGPHNTLRTFSPKITIA